MIPEQIKQSVQEVPDAIQYGASDFWDTSTYRGPILPEWGTRHRERMLRMWYRHEYNWMVQGAFSGIMKRISSTPWEIQAPDTIAGSRARYYAEAYKVIAGAPPQTDRPDIEYFQQVIRLSDFGRGWASFCQKGVDYLRQDGGWYWEIIAPGAPDKPPTGPVMGIAHLDSVRCVPTGDPLYPVVYYSRNGKLHLMHHTRVVQLVDMPDGDEAHPGYGLSALSRAIAIVSRQSHITRYIEQYVDDKPPPGIIVTNMSKEHRRILLQEYSEQQNMDELPVFGQTAWAHIPGENVKAVFEMVNFSQAPEKFDFKTYTELDIDALALAIGVDKQELWQLTSGSLGSGAQSEILQAKARGKTIGTLLTQIERTLNDILPEEYEFTFKARDDQEELTQAQIAQTWATAISTVSSNFEPDEIRYLLANTVEAFKDAMIDENGELRRVNDVDVQPEIEPSEIILDENSGTAPASDDSPAGVGDGVGGREYTAAHQKAIQATRLDFESDFAAFTGELLAGNLNSRRAGIVGRAILNRYGRRAALDGLADGGVNTDVLEGEDLATYQQWLAEQSVFLRDYIDKILEGTQYTPDARAELWSGKSLMDAYRLGQLLADRNGMYEWMLSDAEHCKDCLRLSGQRHRLKSWHEKGLVPKSDQLECKIGCKCRFQKTTERARGRF